MRYLIRSILITSLITCICITLGCQSESRLEKNTEALVPDLEAIIKSNVDSFYTAYKRHNYDWIDFFENEFTNIFPDTPIRKISKDSTKAIWKDIYNRYQVQLIDYGKPSFIVSKDMVISHNSFNEIFIHKQTQDTIKNVGTYVIAWRRQADDSWKIVFETVQNI